MLPIMPEGEMTGEMEPAGILDTGWKGGVDTTGHEILRGGMAGEMEPPLEILDGDLCSRVKIDIVLR